MLPTKVILVLVALATFAACAPSSVPAAPVPRYEECTTYRGPAFGCDLHAQWVAGQTWAYAGAWTTEPPTFIEMELTLERQLPDGSWVLFWIERPAVGQARQSVDVRAPAAANDTIQCLPGNYRWRLRVQFAGNATTYTKLGPVMAL